MHAFFDESRIPPEDRRAIAKDTEELVMASQPDASPLAFDTISRHFASTYTTAALARVADAYDLDLVRKRIAHDPKLGSELDSDVKSAPAPLSTGAKTSLPAAAAPVNKTASYHPLPSASKPSAFSKSGAIDYRMESGAGRERTVEVRVQSQAAPARMWEVLTGYDRIKQFVPDVLVSEQEGRDGAAIIIHTVSLTRLFFFVFKVNLHLRIIEHPQQHSLDFERIAGEFEQFRGSIELPSEAGNTTLVFHAALTPKGHMPDWVIRGMARHFLLPVLDAIRAQAEAH
jgi:hypothetical protein